VVRINNVQAVGGPGETAQLDDAREGAHRIEFIHG
jgi:hypothetical protein